jgi:threonyl-tRNA synthetase
MVIDHRKLGRELHLFDSDPLVGSGLPLWLPAGAAARHEVEAYLYELERRHGYQHVYSPSMGKRAMYERSGHWRNFADDMYPPMSVGGDELVLRPSLCPHHALIFKSRQRSYRDLPLRIAELGPMYRAERSGVVGGLQRVRSMQLNDAHIFGRLDQAGDEVAAVLRLMRVAHAALGVRVSAVRLSLRGDSGKYAGDEEGWARSERILRDALKAAGQDYEDAPGEAAFYGPKIDVQIADPAGRESTLATVQVDFHQPVAFDLSYADESGGRSRPVMIHRSLAGSMERLFAHLIEVHEGAFPLWYAPVQVVAAPVSDDQAASARDFAASAVAAGLRAEVEHDGSVGLRIRAAAQRKIPYVAVIGAREAAAGEVALRLRDGRQMPAVAMDRAIGEIAQAAVVSRDRP